MYRKNVAGQNLPFALVNASSGAALTLATVTARRSIDGGAQAAATGTVTELANGQYNLALSQADTNGNNIGILLTATNAIPVHFTIVTTAADPTDTVRFGLTALPNAAAAATGGLDCTVVFGGTASAGSATSLTLTGASATDNIYNHLQLRIQAGTGAGQIRTIVAYNGTTKVASVDRNWTTTPDNTSVFSVIGPTIMPSWNLFQGLASAGSSTTVTLAGASSTSSIYNGALVIVTAGTGARQARICTAYNGGTGVLTVDRAWQTNPDSTSIIVILAADLPGADGAGNLSGSVASVAGAVGSVTGAVGSVTGNVGGNVTGSVGSVASGGITSGSFAASAINAAAIATDAITAAKIAADAIGASELAADAVTEIQTGLATAAALATVQADTDDIQTRLPAALVSGRIDASVGAMVANTVTAAALATDAGTEIADAILDRDMSVGTDSGSPTVRTVRQALRALRNRFSITGNTRIVYKEDDAATSWTSTITTSASADAIVADDPAGP